MLVFKNLQDDEIQYLPPHDAVETQDQKAKLIEVFNKDWKDPAWRDIVYTGYFFCYLKYKHTADSLVVLAELSLPHIDLKME